MMDPDLEYVAGGLATIAAAIGGWGWWVLNNRIKEQGEALDKEIGDNVKERRRLHERIDKMAEDQAKARLEDHRTFANKDDIRGLRTDIADMLERHETHVREIVLNRPPVKP